MQVLPAKTIKLAQSISTIIVLFVWTLLAVYLGWCISPSDINSERSYPAENNSLYIYRLDRTIGAVNKCWYTVDARHIVQTPATNGISWHAMPSNIHVGLNDVSYVIIHNNFNASPSWVDYFDSEHRCIEVK